MKQPDSDYPLVGMPKVGTNMSKSKSNRVLVAETDERGQVSCVWVKRERFKHAHPVRDPREITQRIAEFEVAGAAHSDVISWLNARPEPM